jgi:hypothetical protein
MVSVNLKGGIGNMMFQVAFIEDLARRNGYEVVYPDMQYVFTTMLGMYAYAGNCFEYLKMFKNFDWNKNHDKNYRITTVKHIPHVYTQIVPEDDVLYDGYFQCERYFDRDETLNLFEPSDAIAKFLPKEIIDATSIHVRRGDYLKHSDTYCELNTYYFDAIDYLSAKDVLVFSDDYEWCRKYFKGRGFTYFDEFKPTLNYDYHELFWMAKCKNNIIANSSFSWWGSYLNKSLEKKVIAPAKWYMPICKYTAQDIYTSNMIII